MDNSTRPSAQRGKRIFHGSSCDTFSTWPKCWASKDLSAHGLCGAHLDSPHPGRAANGNGHD
jgi:hypothetical protein